MPWPFMSSVRLCYFSKGWFRTREINNMVSEVLPYKQEDLSLVLRSHVKKPDMVACTINPSTREEKAAGSL